MNEHTNLADPGQPEECANCGYLFFPDDLDGDNLCPACADYLNWEPDEEEEEDDDSAE